MPIDQIGLTDERIAAMRFIRRTTETETVKITASDGPCNSRLSAPWSAIGIVSQPHIVNDGFRLADAHWLTPADQGNGLRKGKPSLASEF
jgi:hypothetical protein